MLRPALEVSVAVAAAALELAASEVEAEVVVAVLEAIDLAAVLVAAQVVVAEEASAVDEEALVTNPTAMVLLMAPLPVLVGHAKVGSAVVGEALEVVTELEDVTTEEAVEVAVATIADPAAQTTSLSAVETDMAVEKVVEKVVVEMVGMEDETSHESVGTKATATMIQGNEESTKLDHGLRYAFRRVCQRLPPFLSPPHSSIMRVRSASFGS